MYIYVYNEMWTTIDFLTGTYFLIYKRDNINYEQISPAELRYLRVKPLYILN